MLPSCRCATLRVIDKRRVIRSIQVARGTSVCLRRLLDMYPVRVTNIRASGEVTVMNVVLGKSANPSNFCPNNR